eukprot:350371-Chlamydomonas_euryale.AAC.3
MSCYQEAVRGHALRCACARAPALLRPLSATDPCRPVVMFERGPGSRISFLNSSRVEEARGAAADPEDLCQGPVPPRNSRPLSL